MQNEPKYRYEAREAIILALMNCDKGTMSTSAKECAYDAQKLFEAGNYLDSLRRALNSLKYSVGIFSVPYKKMVVMTRGM